ncbi:MAG: hypothetical protein C0482_04685 [Gordonia sp.]|nr:hypothetical protein [Gordonia sp. (in: high G+C Gram-positive bacteria)]
MDGVHSLGNEVVAVSGKVTFYDGRVVHGECARLIEQNGASFNVDFSSRVSILVQGDLSNQRVTDPDNRFSKKLRDAYDKRSRGEHVHVISDHGFEDLTNGFPADCLPLSKTERGGVYSPPGRGDGILGRRLKPRKPSSHDPIELTADLAALDRGTAAHTETIRLLSTYLFEYGIQTHDPVPGAPLFDAGWSWRGDIYIAEVKSLGVSVAAETQQIRLGLGQILDYSYQLNNGARPVLVLERSPSDGRWHDVCKSVGVLLTYPPFFGL